MVRSRVRGGIVALGMALGEPIPGIAGTFLEIAAALTQLHALDDQPGAEPLAQRAHERLVLVGSGTQPVVDVKRQYTRPQAQGHVEQAHRVAAAREQHQQRLAGAHQAALAGDLQSPVAHGTTRASSGSLSVNAL